VSISRILYSAIASYFSNSRYLNDNHLSGTLIAQSLERHSMYQALYFRQTYVSSIVLGTSTALHSSKDFAVSLRIWIYFNRICGLIHIQFYKSLRNYNLYTWTQLSFDTLRHCSHLLTCVRWELPTT
jgi:hypothetical protein